eukprot:2744864-Rhodomonas_salina.2
MAFDSTGNVRIEHFIGRQRARYAMLGTDLGVWRYQTLGQPVLTCLSAYDILAIELRLRYAMSGTDVGPNRCYVSWERGGRTS